MITTKLDNGRVFLHNGDFSGDLLINCADSEVEMIDTLRPDPPMIRVSIPFEDVKAIVAVYIARRICTALETALETAGPDAILFGVTDPTATSTD